MTKEEAIQILADLTDNPFLSTWEEQYKALHMAIEALQREEAEAKGYCHRLKPKQDLISRTEDRLYIKIYADDEPSLKAQKLYQICGETQNREVTEWLKEYFPSADRLKGKWEYCEHAGISDVWKCNQCGAWMFGKTNYCPNCGARMKGGDDE